MFSKKIFVLILCFCFSNFNTFAGFTNCDGLLEPKAHFHIHRNGTISESLSMCTTFQSSGIKNIFLIPITKCPCVKNGDLYMGEYNLGKTEYIDYFLFFNPISNLNLKNETLVVAKFIIKPSIIPYATLKLNKDIGHFDVEIKPEENSLNVSISGNHREHKDRFILVMEIGTPLTITSFDKDNNIELEINA